MAKPLNFSAQFNSNPQVKIQNYYWFIENKKLENQPALEHSLQDRDFFQLVFLKFTDANGFSAYRGALVEGTNGIIQFSFPPNAHNELVISSQPAAKTAATKKGQLDNKLVFLIGGGVVAHLVVLASVRLKKRP